MNGTGPFLFWSQSTSQDPVTSSEHQGLQPGEIDPGNPVQPESSLSRHKVFSRNWKNKLELKRATNPAISGQFGRSLRTDGAPILILMHPNQLDATPS